MPEPAPGSRQDHSSQADFNRAPLRPAASRWDWLAVALCFSAALGFALFRIRLGIAVAADEGFYLAAPLRYALGDLPFRDEFFNPLRMFDIVLAPLFWLDANLGLYQLRLLWALAQLTAMGALTWLFARFAPLGLVALASAAGVWIPHMIWTPAYHLMGGTCFILAWSIWLGACLTESPRRRLVLAIASGVAMYLGAMSYVPLLALEIVPASVLLHAGFAGGRGKAPSIASFVHIGTVGVLALLTVLSFAVVGLLGDWWNAYLTINSLGPYQITAGHKVSIFAAQTLPYGRIVLAGFALGLLLPLAGRLVAGWAPGRAAGGEPNAGRRWLASLAVAAGLTALLFAVFYALKLPSMGHPYFPYRTETIRPFRVVALLIGLQLAVSSLALNRRRAGSGPSESRASWQLVSRSTLAGSLILAFLFAFFSSMVFKAMFAAPAIVVVVAVALYRLLRGESMDRPIPLHPMLWTTTLCLCIAVVAYQTRSQGAFREWGPFEHPRFAGVFEHPERVEELERLADYLAGRVQPGDRLLAFEAIPIVYFLTGTRPAIDHAWPSRVIPNELKRQALQKMQAAGRTPEYAVQAMGRFGSGYPNALNDFVEEGYEKQFVVGRYAVWKRRPAAVAPPGLPTR